MNYYKAKNSFVQSLILLQLNLLEMIYFIDDTNVVVLAEDDGTFDPIKLILGNHYHVVGTQCGSGMPFFKTVKQQHHCLLCHRATAH